MPEIHADSGGEPEKNKDDERYMLTYLQHIDMMKQLGEISIILKSVAAERKESKSFAAFTSSMVIIVMVVAAISVAAVFSFTH